jgi:hypothetical protein
MIQSKSLTSNGFEIVCCVFISSYTTKISLLYVWYGSYGKRPIAGRFGTISSFSITCKRRVSMDIIYIRLTKYDLVISLYVYNDSKINLIVLLYLHTVTVHTYWFRVVLFKCLIIPNIYANSEILLE